jgi:hypothetical protein
VENDRDEAGTASSFALEELTREECLALLAVNSVGRIAVIGRDDMPFVVPVNYQLDGENVVFRTDPGTKLDGLKRHPVAFQIDAVDPVQRVGWSVLVQGVAHEASPEEVESAAVDPWLQQRRHWIQLVPRFISGRRIRLPDVPYEPGGYL